MPRKRNYKPRKKVYRRRKKKSYSGSSAVINNRLNMPFPKKYVTTLRYNDRFVLDAGAALAASHVYVANGLWDTDYTGGGHQPYGFDTIMPLYDHYVVIGCKFTVTFMNRDASNTQVVGITVRDRVTTTTDWRINTESGNTKWTNLGVETASSANKTLRYNLNPAKFLGISKPLASENLRGTISTNPAETANVHIWATSGTAADVGFVDCFVQIQYRVVFIEPQQIALS